MLLLVYMLLKYYNTSEKVYYNFNLYLNVKPLYHDFLQEPLVLTTLISLFVRLHSIVRVGIKTNEFSYVLVQLQI